MTTTLLIVIIYAAIGVGVGWYMGQYTYHHGTKDGIRPGNAGYSIFTMVVYGAAWAILAGALAIALLCDIIPWSAIARKIFRGP